MPATPYMQRPPIPGGPPAPHPAGSPAFAAPPLPHYTHTPYAPHQPLVEVHSQPAYPAYYLREPRYGLPPPPSPLPTVPPPDHRDLELAYLRGHVAGLDRRTEGPPPPKEAAQRAPPAPQGPAPDVVGEATPALLLAPARETEPRQDRRPPAPTEPPRRPQGATYRRSRSPRRDLRDDRRDHGRTSPDRGGRTAHRRPYRSPKRYYQRRPEERPSERRAPAARGGDRTPDRLDYRSRRDPPGSAPGPGRERRGPDDRRRYRSPSPDTARRLRYDAPDTGRRPQWEPRTAPDAQPPHVPHVPRDKPQRKRQRHNKEGGRPAAQSPAGTPHKLPVHALTGTQTTPGLLAPCAQQTRLPQDCAPRTPQKHRTGVTQTTPGLRGPGYASPSGAMKAPQQPRAADPPTVLHIRRLPTGWSRRHLADRFMWLDGAEGVAEAFYGGENHGYLTFRAHTQALAACAVVSAALGTVAPPPGRLPAAVHCVNRSVIRDLTVHTQRDAPGEERYDTPSAGAATPHMDRPSLTEDDVRRLIADAVGGTRQVVHPRPQEPARAPTADAVGGAGRLLPRGPPPAQQTPISRERDPALPGGGAAPERSPVVTAAWVSPPARPRAAAKGRTSQLSRRVLAATGTPSDPGQPAAGHASAGPPRPGPSKVAAESVSQDLLGADCREEGHQQALASAPEAPAARPKAPAGNPMTAQAHDGAEASAPPTGGHPPEGPALDWCTVCRFWRPSPCDQCPPQGAPQEEDEAAEQAPEGERELRPRETSPALETPTSHAAGDPPPPPIDVDASQGTATQLAGLLDDEAGALSPLEPLPPAEDLDDDPAPPAAGRADSPPGELGPHESRLAALIADTALEEANPCKALDVAVFLDSERLSAVGRRMRAAGQDTTPVPGPHSPEGDGLPPLLAQYAKRTRELLQLVGYTLGVPSFSLSSWEGDAIPAPHPPGLGITVYYVIEGRVQLRLPAPEGGSRPGWWLQAMAYAYAWSAPPPPRAVPPDTRALVLIYQCPVHVPRGTPATAPPPVQICVKRGDRYTPVDTASMDLGDHRATLTPPGGNPLAIATPMVARATYDRARGGLVIVPSALGAQQLRDADWKGWSASWVSYARALQSAKPVGFKVLGA